MSNWTEERVDTLKTLWADGYSASQIAAKLGGVSRNGVIGKVHRLNLSDRRTVVVTQRRTRAETAADNRTRMLVKRAAAPPPRLEPSAEATRQPRIETRPAKLLTLFELTERTCKWPFGHPRNAGFGFCGAAKDRGQPYCGDHNAIAYRAPDPRRRLKAAQRFHKYLTAA